MKTIQRHKGLILCIILAIAFMPLMSAFADSTRYYYDDVNRVMRVESGGGSAIITATAGSNGSISPPGVIGVRFSDSQTFYIYANPHYHIADVKVDGVSVGAVSTYTFSNVTGNHTIDAQFAIDPAAVGTLTINSAAVATNSTGVSLSITCNDGAGCVQMQFSNDNVTWSAAEAFAATKAWTMSTGDGVKAVYAKLMDSAGNWSQAFSAAILLDTVQPVTTASTADGLYSTAMEVALRCSDAGGSGCDRVYYTTDGTTPTTASTVYSGPVVISATTTLKYFAKDRAGNSESVKSRTYTIDTTLLNTGIRLVSAPQQSFTTLQAAYNAAIDGDTIKVHAASFDGDITVNRPISISIEGGYAIDYMSITGTTNLRGMIQTQPGAGLLNIKNFILIK